MFHDLSIFLKVRSYYPHICRTLTDHLLNGNWSMVGCYRSFVSTRCGTIDSRINSQICVSIPQIRYKEGIFLIRPFSTILRPKKLVKDMSTEELIALFNNSTSSRMELVKAGELLYQQPLSLTETVILIL